TVSRLVNMGIEPFLVATSINLICAQRLVRRACKDCKREIKMPVAALTNIGFTAEEAPTVKVMKGAGCQTCNGSGYKGRVGLYEVMELTDKLRETIMSGATALDIKKQALEEGMISLRRSGLIKIMNGVTTVDEVLRETIK